MQATAFVSPWLNQILVRGIITVGLQVWIVIVMWRKQLARRFPLFLLYMLYQIAEGIFRWVFEQRYGTGSGAYFQAYWDTEAGELLLEFLALGESSWHIFSAYRKLRPFWGLLMCTVGIAVAYGVFAAWRDIPGKITFARLMMRADVLETFIYTGVALIFFGLIFRLHLFQWYSRESSIILGLGVTSAAGVVMLGLTSYFGKSIQTATYWVSPWGYILAEVIWIREFLRPDPPKPSNEELAMLRPILEEANQALDRYSEALKEIGKSK